MRVAYINKLLASLFLIATFLGAFHHHHDAGLHQDCPIHILEASIISGDIPSKSLFEKIETVYQTPSEIVVPHPDTTVNFTYFGRAPPHFS